MYECFSPGEHKGRETCEKTEKLKLPQTLTLYNSPDHVSYLIVLHGDPFLFTQEAGREPGPRETIYPTNMKSPVKLTNDIL